MKKTKIFKRIYAMLLAFAMAVTVFPNVALAATKEISEINFSLEGFAYSENLVDTLISTNTEGIEIDSVEWYEFGDWGSPDPIAENCVIKCREYCVKIFFHPSDEYKLSDSLSAQNIYINEKDYITEKYFNSVGSGATANNQYYFFAYLPIPASPCEAAWGHQAFAISSPNDYKIGKDYHYSECIDCGYKLKSAHTLKCVVEQKATTEVEGSMYNICTECTYEDSTHVEISKLGYVCTENDQYTFSSSPIEPKVLAYDIDGNQISSEYYDVTYTNNNAVGTATATCVFKERYEGSLSCEFEITDKKVLEKSQFILKDNIYEYTGDEIEPWVICTDDLMSEDDYSVEYIDNIVPGEARIIITGREDYTGTVKLNFTITPKIIKSINFTISGFEYGKPIDEATITTDNEDIEIRKTIWYLNNTDGLHDIATGNFSSDQFSLEIYISRRAFTEYGEELAVDNVDNVTVDGAEITAEYFDDENKVKFPELDADRRYYVYFKLLPSPCGENHTFGEWKSGSSYHARYCTVCGICQKQFHVYEKITLEPTSDQKVYTIDKCKICGSENPLSKECIHDPLTHKVNANWVSDEEKHWHECANCDYKFDNSKHELVTTTTKATATSDGLIETKCKICGKVTQKVVIDAYGNIELSNTKYTYNGKNKKPDVVVKDKKGNIIDSSNYDVSYPENCKNVGTYQATVTFKGKYTGTKTLTYKIDPPKTSIKKLSSKNKSFTLKWTKKSKQVTGYEFEYSKSKKFKKLSTKTVKIKKANTTSKSIKKLRASNKYYVRIRTYKTVGKKVYYSAWSTTKNVTIKK